MTMKPVNDYLPRTPSEPPASDGSRNNSRSTSWKASEEAREKRMRHHLRRMQRVWEVMIEAHGNLWRASFGETPNDTWVRELAGLSDEQMRRGVDKVLKGKAEGQRMTLQLFRRLCLGDYADHSMLEPDLAFQAAARGEWWHRGVFHAVSLAGGPYAFRRLPAREAAQAFRRGYRSALEAVQEGRRLCPAPIAPPDAKKLAEPTIRQRDINAGLREMAKIKATLGMRTDNDDD